MKRLSEPPGRARFEAQLRELFAGNPERTQFLDQTVFRTVPATTPELRIAGELEAPPETRVVRRAVAARARAAPPVAARAPSGPARREQKRERTRERLQRAQRASELYLQRVHRLLASEGVPYDVRKDCAIIPRSGWVQASAILADASGRAARIHLKQMRNKVLAGAIKRAALCDGRYAWSDDRARFVVALGVALAYLAKRTRRRGRWEFLVKGVPQGALLALLRDPWTGKRPHRSALAGVHRTGAEWLSGEVGWLRALEGAGALYCQQLPAHDAQPCELLGPSGYATNRIWLVTDVPTAPLDDDDKRALLALHRVGLEAADVRPLRVVPADVLAELARAVTGPPASRAPL